MVSGVAVAQTPDAKPAGETSAQKYSLSGVVYDETMSPVVDAIISTPGHAVARTDADGRFEMKDVKEWATVKVTADGYYSKEIRVNRDIDGAAVYMVRKDKRNYNETELSTVANREGAASIGHNDNVARKDFAASGNFNLDKALQGQLTGLQVTQKSGMTGEGSYMALRGVRSLVAENAPLVVINGVPFMPDDNMSSVISGYSRSIFQAINPQDIANVTLLKGAEAAAYGSLGSNGVLLIETDGTKSDDLNTRITFTGSVGVNWSNERLPLMNSTEYKNYLSDIGMDYYGNDMGSFFSEFPFMQSATANNAQLYGFNTNWQDQVMDNSLSQDYMFRVEGGDAIAKYNISLGYTGDQGTLTGTKSDRYNAQINANVLISKQFEIMGAVNLSYLDGDYQEQGYSEETNPLLAAYRRSPLLSPYKTNGVPNADGSYSLLNSYSNYYLGSSTNTDFIVSNPLAIVNTVDASIRQYDVNAKLQLTYRPTSDWTFNALVGLYSNYDKEKNFIPGVDNSAIVPLFDSYGQADNTVRVGQANTFNMFYSLNGQYHKLFNNRHDVTVKAAYQVLTTSTEYDLASGRNTANDFYQTMGDVNSIGRYFSGYNYAWNWANGFITADYAYGNLVKAGVIASVDGASSTGKDVTRAHFYPGAHATLMLANWNGLNNIDWLNQLDVYADYSMTGNSQYSSKLGQYYYTSTPYMSVAGIVRANVPNTKINIEKDKTLNAGLDLTLLRNRVHVKGGYYQTKAEDVLMLATKSSALGSSPYYANDAALRNRGLEVSLQAVAYAGHNFRWTLGGNLTTLNSKVTSLGDQSQLITTLSDDAEIVTKVGGTPYAFYGYKTNGVYSTTAEAKEAGLKNRNSVAYEAGDVRFVDMNGDGIINDEDKVVLGSATPDFYGSFFTSFEYKNWALDLNFVYSKGNKAYNAMRRISESASDFSNQSKAVTRRWQNEGDVTDMPRASYGDLVGNNDFSDRYVEDASYLKLRDITLSYTFNKKVLKLIQGGTIYVSGQNLLCLTDYLGLDPEYSYSSSSAMQGVDYGKVALPKTVKVGVNLKF
jgi:TonB-linked SusC/RagA family outer membrane protein